MPARRRSDASRWPPRAACGAKRHCTSIILLVEDNAINQELAVDLLSRAGVVVSVACNGQEALDRLARERFDVVLMDCQMPVMDGYAATRALRERPALRSLPVIAMTANAMVGDRESVLAAGMDDHIAKPIVVDEMFATLARWIKRAPPMPASETAAIAPLPPPPIDRAKGIANTAGSEALYDRMLGLFRNHETDFVQRFRAAHAAGDVEAALRAAHDLKGEAGTFGMPALQEAATRLERACTEAAGAAEIEQRLIEVAQLLDEVIEQLTAFETARPT
jgi:CheY-like chemotaxis protein